MCVPVLLLLPPLLVRAVQTPGLALPNYASEKCQTVQAMFVESYKQYSYVNLLGHDVLHGLKLLGNFYGATMTCNRKVYHARILRMDGAHQLMIPSTMVRVSTAML